MNCSSQKLIIARQKVCLKEALFLLLVLCLSKVSYADQTFDPAQNRFTPTVSATSDVRENTPAATTSSFESNAVGPLSLPDTTKENVQEPSLGDQLDEMWNKLDLSDEEKIDLLEHLKKLSENASEAIYHDYKQSSSFENNLKEVVSFSETHADNKNVSQFIAVSLGYIFQTLSENKEKIRQSSNQNKVTQEILKTVLENLSRENTRPSQPSPILANATKLTSESTPNESVSLPKENPADLALEILRKEAVNESQTPLARAFYRKAYFSLVKSMRQIHLNQIKFSTEQKLAKQFKLAVQS